MFIQMSGAPGSGKTTVARAIAGHIGAVVIDHDVAKSALLEGEAVFRHQIANMKRPRGDYLVLDMTLPLEVCVEAALIYIRGGAGNRGTVLEDEG